MTMFLCKDLTTFFCHLTASFLWPASRSYTFHFIMHPFFTQPLSSFLKACLYHLNLCHCATDSYVIHSWSVSQLSSTTKLPNHSHLILLTCQLILFHMMWQWNMASEERQPVGTDSLSSLAMFHYVSLPFYIQLCTQLLYNFPLIRSETILLLSRGTSCQNLFHPLRTIASTAALASPSTLSMSPR